MSRPPDAERTEPQHFPADPCLLCGRGRRPGVRCCARYLKVVRFGPMIGSQVLPWIPERQIWAQALGGILDSLDKNC